MFWIKVIFKKRFYDLGNALEHFEINCETSKLFPLDVNRRKQDWGQNQYDLGRYIRYVPLP